MIHIALTHCYKVESLNIIFAVSLQTVICADRYCNLASSLIVPRYSIFCYNFQIFVTIVMRWSG